MINHVQAKSEQANSDFFQDHSSSDQLKRCNFTKFAMDSSNLQCYCGKLFSQLNAFSNHQHHCKSSQQRLTSALTKAQKIWAKKRADQRLRRVSNSDEAGTQTSYGRNVGSGPLVSVSPGRHAEHQNGLLVPPRAESPSIEDLNSPEPVVVCHLNLLLCSNTDIIGDF